MRDDDGSVPLLDGLKNLERQFESALITTYNCYFPFFEEVLLRRLSARGCRHVMLCCDARMLAGALTEPELRPHWAGATYWLAPVSAPSSFHPKVMLFGGRKSARVIVGSHNATYSGFGGNDEVTNVVNVSGAKDRDGAAVLLSALDFVEAWLGNQPDAFRAQLRRFRELTSWAAGPVNAGRPIQFVGSLPEGASLWEQIRPLLPTDATRVTVVGPYFDSKLEFLARLQADLGVEVCVGVQPEQALLDPKLAHTLGGVRFVEATRSTDDDGVGKFLHAKALLVEGRSGTTLISGSANPSFAAWLAAPEGRNAEAVLVRRDNEILDLPLVRWLQSLQAAPALVPADWARFEKPRPGQEATDVRNEDQDSAVPLPLFESKEGLTVEVDGPMSSAELLDSAERPVPVAGIDQQGRSVLIRLEAEHRANARIARLVVGGRSRWGVVHHGEELESTGASSAQQGLRAALTGLILGDATQFESLLKSIDKVIFDQAIPTSVGSRAAGSSSTRADASAAGEIPESLRASPEDMARAARKHRVLESGDLALILDALCRKLGEGLAMNTSSGPIAQSEERLKGSDDEALVEIAQFDLVDTARLAKLCRTKGNTLLRRLGQQIENAQEATEAPTAVIAQAAAVLGVLRQLRRADLKDPWRAAGETLIDNAKLDQFVWESMPGLVCRSDSLLRRAVSGAGEFEEATALRELLGWLAWDCDVVPGRCTGTKETTPKEDAEWWSHFSDAAVELSRDGAARDRLESNLPFTPRPERSAEKWLKAFEDWGVMLAASPDRFRSGRLEPGDLVFIPARNRVGYVLDHHEGKVSVRDFDKDSGKLTFDERFVKPLEVLVGGASAVSGRRG